MIAALQRRYGRARRSKKRAELTQKQAAKLLVEIIADMLGGEGWDDPRLPALVQNGWMEWPAYEKTVDTAYVQGQADSLIEQGFDPRHLV